jgi:hypothetical protein
MKQVKLFFIFGIDSAEKEVNKWLELNANVTIHDIRISEKCIMITYLK